MAENENAEREVNTMKILLKNMEESKAGEMKKYKESIMRENERIQVIKEGIYMHMEDMHARAAQGYRILMEEQTELKKIREENKKVNEEIEKMKEILEGANNEKEGTQEVLERTQ